jgi:hypothetical protein
MSSLVKLTTSKGREINLDEIDGLADRIEELTDMLAARSEQITELRSVIHDRSTSVPDPIELPAVAEIKRALAPEVQHQAMYRKVAVEKYKKSGSFSDGDIDFDAEPEVSAADADADGAYVAAWVWVSKDEIE